MKKSVGALLVIFILMLPSMAVGDETPFSPPPLKDYVTDPSHTNFLFINFSGPTIYPGDMGNLNFKLNNPYNRSMENIVLYAEIYAYATLETYRYIDENFSNPPTIANGDGLKYNTSRPSLDPESSSWVNLSIDTNDETPEGVYYVRFCLQFDYPNSTNGSIKFEHFVMRSMSFFSKEDWDYATIKPTNETKQYYRHGVNMTYLNKIMPVDAIIPFISFSVRRGIPKWPLFVFIGLIGVSATLAYMYYMNDNYGKYPWLDEKTRQIAGKYEEFRRRLYERARKR
jgi:hypothetical protein